MRIVVAQPCKPGCQLCAGAGLDTKDLRAEVIEHAERCGRGRIYLHGQRVTLHSELGAVVHAATSRGLKVAVIEDDADLEAGTISRSLQGLRIERIYLSLPIPAAPPKQGAPIPAMWKKLFDTLVTLERGRALSVGLHAEMHSSGLVALSNVLRFQARLGIRHLLLSDPGRERLAAEGFDAPRTLATLDRLWNAAHDLGILLRLVGFAGLQTAQARPAPRPAPWDPGLGDLARAGIELPSLQAGLVAVPTPPATAEALPKSTAGLRDLAFEMAACRAPFVDLPLCLGGAPRFLEEIATAAPAAPFRKGNGCTACPADARCPGLPEGVGLDRPVDEVLQPLPRWYSLGTAPRIVILSSRGGDPLYYISTLPALADALHRQGGKVETISPWSARWSLQSLPELGSDGGEWMGTALVVEWLGRNSLADVDLVVTSDFPTARVVLAEPSLNPQARVIVTDFHMLERMDLALAAWLAPGARAAEGGWWPSPRLVLESGFPGYAPLYRNYGVPPEQIVWRPYALCPTHFPNGPEVTAATRIFSGGNHLRDLATLRRACELLRPPVHGVDLYAPGDQLPGNAHLEHRGQVHISEFLAALRRSRFAILPLQEEPTRAAGITVLAMALFAGRPLVATNTAATRDYLQHDVDALLVPPNDPLALAQAITRLDTEPGLLARLAAGARETATRMSTDTWARDLLSGQPSGPRWTPTGWRPW